MMSLPPNQATQSMHAYTIICINGNATTMIFSAENCSFCTVDDTFLNLSISLSSLTNAFTARMPIRFSCVDSFMASYLWSIFSNLGKMILTPTIKPMISTGKATAKISERSGLIEIAMQVAKTSIIGERTSIRMTI